MPHKVCRWLMAAGKRPVPFRTRKLSPPAPMVLPPGGSGRVGYRRPNNFTHNTRLGNTTLPRRVLFMHARGPCPTTSGHHALRNHDGAYCGAKVEYRTSSTPAYTDGLDLHHSTNNAPTTTLGRSRLRIADNRPTTHDWFTPTNYRARHTQRRYPTSRRVIKQPPRPFSATTPGNRNARARPASSWTARRSRPSCGRARAWTTGPGGSTSWLR